MIPSNRLSRSSQEIAATISPTDDAGATNAANALFISDHAVERYQERVDPSLSAEAVRAALGRHWPAIAAAARFGCATVNCGSYKLVLDGDKVITVLSKGWASRSLMKPLGSLS